MAMTRKPSQATAIFVALLLLFAPLMSIVGASPSGDGSPPAGVGAEPTSVDDEEPIPFYTILKGPNEIYGFAQQLTNLGDVDGDGLDDIIIGTGSDILDGKYDDRDIAPGLGTIAYVLLGRDDRTYTSSQLVRLGNSSAWWSYHSKRWIGDLNGDGHADLVTDLNYFWWREGEEEPKPVVSQASILVYYGTDDGFPISPDLIIDTRPSDLPEDAWTQIDFGGVGDVNGDGFNDLFVYRHLIEYYKWEDPGQGGNGRDDPDEPPKPDPEPPRPEPNITVWPADFQLYYGSEDGLSETPDWNGTPDIERWWYIQGIHHADVNGDGHSDVILSSSSAPHISVYHGSEDGIPLTADRVVTFNADFSYGWQLHAPVDLDGDEYEDVVIDYGQSQGLFDYVQYVYLFPGSEGGIPVTPAEDFVLKSKTNGRVVMTDINGDGLDDVLIHAKKQVTNEEGWVDVFLQVHFNSGSAFPENPSWQQTIKRIEGSEYQAMSDGGDFDGDGLGDAAIGIPGGYIWRADGTYNQVPGIVIFVHGAGIMDMLRPLTLIGGPLLYADYQSYDFRVNANPTGGTILPERVAIVLDPGGAGVELEAGFPFGGSYIVESSDPEDLVVLTSDLMDIVRDTANNTIWVHFRVLFNWSWPHEDLCDVTIRFIFEATPITLFTAKNVFRVENDLDLLGDVGASGSLQGELDEGDWVRSGEEVTVSGPVVVYQGTTDLYPRDGVCQVALRDDDGTQVTTALVSGGAVSLSMAVDDATDTDELLTLTLVELPGLAEVITSPTFAIRVDGDAPAFANPVPEPDDWHSSKEVLVSITADDGETSGVRASTMEYSYSTNGGVTWTDWTRQGLETSASGPTVDGLVLLELPDGDDNLVRWRARDRVGNGPAVSEGFRIKVDTVNVTYTGAFPDPSVWQRALSVLCGVTITDADGAGIEVASIQFRVSHQNLSGYDEWMDWDEGSQGNALELPVSAMMDLAQGPYNFIQWRAKDIAGNGYTTSPHYKVRVDVTPISFDDFAPTDGPFAYSDIECFTNVTDGELGSGVALWTIEYRVRTGEGDWGPWTDVGMEGSSPQNRFSVVVTFADGDDNRIQFRGMDVAGNGPAESAVHTLTVDTTAPGFGEITPGPDAKQPDLEVVVRITVTDAIVGVDPATWMYRYSTSGESGLASAEWLLVTTYEVEDDGLSGQATLTLARGRDNAVQFKAADVLGNEALSQVASVWVNRLPTASIRTPTSDGEYREEEPVVLNATGSSDPDGDVLNYTWYRDGTVIGHGRVLQTSLPPGTVNVTLVVRDDVGEEATSWVIVSVAPFVPPKSSDGVGTWVLVAVVLLAVVGGMGAYMYNRRRIALEAERLEQADEWEPV